MRVIAGLAVCVLALMPARVSAQPYSTTPLETWGVNGTINAIERVGNRVFVGGAFTRAVQPRGGLLAISGTTGELVRAFPNVLPGIQAIAPDGHGGWYIGGGFDSVRPGRANLLHLLSDGTIDPAFAPGVSEVGSIVVAPGKLLAVTNFNSQIVAFDLTTGARVTWNQPVHGVQRIELLSDSRLLVYGTFTTVNSARRTGIAMVDVNSGVLLPWAPDLPGFQPQAAPIGHGEYAVDGNDIFFCGRFTTVNGQAQRFLAKVDLTSGRLLAWSPQLAAMDQLSQCSIAVSASTVYVALSGATNNLSVKQMLALDRNTGTRIESFQPPANIPDSFFHSTRLLVAHGRLYFYTRNLTAPPEAYHYLWALDATTGALVSAWSPRPDAGVGAVVVIGPDLLIGGSFVGVQSVARNRLMALELDSGALVDWNPLAGQVEVSNIAATETRLFVHARSSDFSMKVFDLSSLQEVVWPFTSRAVSNIRALPDRVIVALGSNSERTAEVLQILDPITASRLTPALIFERANATGIDVHTVSLVLDRVYVHGVFDFINGELRSGFAAFNVNSGALLSWVPPPPAPSSSVQRLVHGPGFIAIDRHTNSDTPILLTHPDSGVPLRYVSVFFSPLLEVFDGFALTSGGVSIRLSDTTTGALRWLVSTHFLGPDGSASPSSRAWHVSDSHLIVRGGTRVNDRIAARLLIFPATSRVTQLAANVSGRHVMLSWQLPMPAATELIVEVGSASGRNDIASVSIPGSLTGVSGDLPPGTYYARVRGSSGGNISWPSNEVTFTVGQLPGAPRHLAAVVAPGNAHVDLAWSAPATGNVTGYIIEVGSAPGRSDLAAFVVAATTFRASNPPRGTYFVRVRALNNDGSGPASNEVTVVVP